MATLVERLEAVLIGGEDTALLRFSLGNAYLADNPAQAVIHLRQAVALNPTYSAAWKILGRALVKNDEETAAIDAYRRGIKVANENGDKQAAKEMQVFLRRLLR